MKLFTEAEKVMFTKNNIDYRNPNYKEDNLEEFTLKNIDTINLKHEEHIKTKSLILAPFNTSAGESDFLCKTLELNNNLMKLNGKVRELNKNYELNNNGEIDNGMIISPNGNTFNSLNNDSFNEKITNSPKKSVVNSKYMKPGMILSVRGSGLSSPLPEEIIPLKQKDFSDKDKLSNIYLDKKDKFGNQFILDEKIISQVASFGYSINFIIKSLMLNDLNYATASYYLLSKHD